MDIPNAPLNVSARIRYNSPEVEGTLFYLGDGRIKVEFKNPQMSVTPGQSVVFYQGDVVLGGAVIEEPIRCTPHELPVSLMNA
jgi:tRNA-specific 2-thiouridylase